MATRDYSAELRAAVMAALLAGQSVSSVAREYNIPKGTVAGWKRQALGLAQQATAVGKRDRRIIFMLVMWKAQKAWSVRLLDLELTAGRFQGVSTVAADDG